MKVFVTGASGFLGREVARTLHTAGTSFTASDRVCPGSIGRGTSMACDILDPVQLLTSIQGHSAVIHVAGLAHIFDPRIAAKAPYREINTVGTANVVRAAVAASVDHVVIISSVSVYGHSAPGILSEDAACLPESEYARTKLAGETEAIKAVSGHATRLTILRMATIYGEEDPGNVRRLVEQIAAGKFLWIGKGTNKKSLIYREDAARACVEVLKRQGEQIRVFNVTAPPDTMKNIVDAIYTLLGKTIPSWHIPAGPALRLARFFGTWTPVCRGTFYKLAKTIEKWLADDAFDGSRLEHETGFRTQITFPDGIGREIEWLTRKKLSGI